MSIATAQVELSIIRERKPRAPEKSKEEWDANWPLIMALYHNNPLAQVQSMMAFVGFEATLDQYKKQIRDRGARKYISLREVIQVTLMNEQRRLNGKTRTYQVKGVPMTQKHFEKGLEALEDLQKRNMVPNKPSTVRTDDVPGLEKWTLDDLDSNWRPSEFKADISEVCGESNFSAARMGADIMSSMGHWTQPSSMNVDGYELSLKTLKTEPGFHQTLTECADIPYETEQCQLHPPLWELDQDHLHNCGSLYFDADTDDMGLLPWDVPDSWEHSSIDDQGRYGLSSQWNAFKGSLKHSL